MTPLKSSQHLVASAQVERLVPPLGGEDVDHADCSLLVSSAGPSLRTKICCATRCAERCGPGLRRAARGARRRGASLAPRRARPAAARACRGRRRRRGRSTQAPRPRRRHQARGCRAAASPGCRRPRARGSGTRAGRSTAGARATNSRSSTSWGRSCSNRAGQPVGLVPGVAEHVGQEALDDAVPADARDGGPAPGDRELHAAVGPVIDKAAIGEPLHGGGDGARRQLRAPRRGHRCGPLRRRWDRGAIRQAVDRLQRLALGLRQGGFHGFAESRS